MKTNLTLLITLLLTAFTKKETVISRFQTPLNYQHLTTTSGSFGNWLQNLPLKPAGTHTRTYRGNIAATDAYTAAIVNLSIGKQDLQQCADAVIRLRAEYLYQKKDYQHIHFNFTSGFNCDFIHYANGYRYQQNGTWKLQGKKDYSYNNFLRYLNLVFSYAGTLSLEKELKPVNNAADLQIGDVFIKGGSPGHCFIVVDVARNKAGQKQFLLAQSFMPAQNIQILQQSISPWFSLNKPKNIPYGELINPMYLKRFD
ncbi:DUF4846 domain-containing protein [Mucilaginibacter lacusdianchii]|uniref:DUF4846 domain-containing protein n=1 Tax=Mucilaginibacter lacusdianchii TaxID=2684211 RepID=UPI00131BE66E|nr:DUF4846 domain-containing protein [Mucilaginibacter sp. JXJ CY 39]